MCVYVCVYVSECACLNDTRSSISWLNQNRSLPSPVNTLTQPKMEDPSRSPPRNETKTCTQRSKKKQTDRTASFFTVNLGWTNAIWFVELTRWWGDFFPEQQQQWLNMADEQVFWGNVLHYLYYVLSTCTLWRPTCIKKKTQVHKKKEKRETLACFFLCVFVTLVRDLRKKKKVWVGYSVLSESAELALGCFLIDHHGNLTFTLTFSFIRSVIYNLTPNIAQTKKVNSVYF